MYAPLTGPCGVCGKPGFVETDGGKYTRLAPKEAGKTAQEIRFLSCSKEHTKAILRHLQKTLNEVEEQFGTNGWM